jgi:hypothetical protein
MTNQFFLSEAYGLLPNDGLEENYISLIIIYTKNSNSYNSIISKDKSIIFLHFWANLGNHGLSIQEYIRNTLFLAKFKIYLYNYWEIRITLMMFPRYRYII